MEHALEVENLQKSFSKSGFSLKDISFSVPYGSIVGFIGENGAGKTSTMGTILGTLRKDSGYIRAFGEEMSDEIFAIIHLIVSVLCFTISYFICRVIYSRKVF